MSGASRVPPYEWDRLDAVKFADEEALLEALLAEAILPAALRDASIRQGREIVMRARARGARRGMMESFLDEFGLTNSEGLALMCLAEALLRVPDPGTRDELIAEKIRSGNWDSHQGRSDSWLVNASTWGLMLTGRILGPPEDARQGPGGFVSALLRKSGEPVIRSAMMQAMRIMGEQFVLGRTIDEAVSRGKRMIRSSDAAHFSFDMLGEGARTRADADRYQAAYLQAVRGVAADVDRSRGPENVSGISVKLSALHPRYLAIKESRVMSELYPRVLALCQEAASANIGLCLDAEEAHRLVISLKIFERLAHEPSLSGWEGLGLAVQAYQKRARKVIGEVAALAQNSGRRFMVRLVKGAYWDSEIKTAQVEGYQNFPVFTTKQGTDFHYLACARDMLAAAPRIYPAFATHNAHTLACVDLMARAAGVHNFEFQRLHGMGEALYEAAGAGNRVRVYAPVGAHEDLLPYLVRRLLENGANTSFVHSFLDPDVPVEQVVADPVSRVEAGPRRHPGIPTPPRIYGAGRRNSAGHDLSQAGVRGQFVSAVRALDEGKLIAAGPLPAFGTPAGPATDLFSPAGTGRLIGRIVHADQPAIDMALSAARRAQPGWDALGGAARGAHLHAMADALEANVTHLVAVMAREAGKTLADGVAEVREAVDFCRYYARQAEQEFTSPVRLTGPAGETNHISLHGRGVFCCISPWNFPLAIFTGQVAAALAAGNCVVAKPAEQTCLTAFEAVSLFHRAGLPREVLHLLPGAGETTGAALIRDARVDGVCFTGSTHTARLINQALAGRDGPIIPLIAETGGLNGMFVDTTALREQVIDDIIVSAFGSAGQRCSALRLAFLPHASAERIIDGLIGAMNELAIGDPADPQTDIGPVIDAGARAALEAHVERMSREARILHRLDAGDLARSGFGFGPVLVEIDSLDALDEEVFGPVLHILRYDPDEVAALAGQLKAKGFGLTLGIHSRLESFHAAVRAACPVGNTYINRSMIGAVVGVQPFGGEGLSGTGPKAGGPHYLHRFATERTVTVNIAAQGGDPELLSL